MIDIRLETFITLAKVGSYTKTAEILNITQPAVSQHIKFLEEYYDVNLIKKRGKNIYLTEEGQILLNSAKDIEMMYRGLKSKLKNKNSIIKSYKMGASLTIGGYFLPQILGKYKKLNENIDILLQVNNTEEILIKMLNGSLDFALVEGTFDKEKFQYIKLKDDELVFAVSTQNKLATKKEISIKEILEGNLILREMGSGTRKTFENVLFKMGLRIENKKSYMEIGSISAIKSLIEQNLGYSVISKETIKKEISMGTIKIIPIKETKIFREFNFIYIHKEIEEFLKEFYSFCLENT